MINVIAWLGSFAFAICALPQVIKCYKTKSAKDISLAFLLLWLLGEICFIIATLDNFGFVSWLMFNYILNTVFILIILYYKINPH